jgi:hypothetical protein
MEEQKSLNFPFLSILKNYAIIILGDRKFGSVKLSSWLSNQQVKFFFGKTRGYIQQ